MPDKWSICTTHQTTIVLFRALFRAWHVTDLRYSLSWKWPAPFIFQSFFHVVLTNDYSFTTIRLKMIILFHVSDERLMYNICINKIWFTCCCLKTSVPFIVLYFSCTCLTNDSPIPLVLNRPFRFIKCLTNDWPTYSRGHNLVSPQNALSYVYILFGIV